eukprot:5983719-Pyramimonas_sp.AAC.1
MLIILGLQPIFRKFGCEPEIPAVSRAAPTHMRHSMRPRPPTRSFGPSQVDCHPFCSSCASPKYEPADRG